MKERYIKRYGNDYELPSPDEKALMSIFRSTCKANSIMYKPDECFAYLYDLPERYTQMSLFGE